MGGNKVMICPICGRRTAVWHMFTKVYFCLYCDREVIPIVTPQEVRNWKH